MKTLKKVMNIGNITIYKTFDRFLFYNNINEIRIYHNIVNNKAEL